MTYPRQVVVSSLVFLLLLLLVACQTAAPELTEGELTVPLIPTFEDTVLSTQDVSTTSFDTGEALAISGANLYVAGNTFGSIDGENLGSQDVFLRKYNGAPLWGVQFGSRNSDDVEALATDSSGNVYVFGDTLGAIGFQVRNNDNFLAKYNKHGVRQWVRQFGTVNSDSAYDVAVDSNNRVYTLSDEGDNNFVLRKFSASGNLLATKSVTLNNRPDLLPVALAVDSLNNVIVLTRWNNFSNNRGTDIRLFKYSSSLSQLWQKAYSTLDNDFPYDITTDSNNNIYFSFRRSAANRGGYFRKLNASGTPQFTRRLEASSTSSSTYPFTVTTASNDHVYIAGYKLDTAPAFPGYTNAGSGDIVVFRYSPSGARRWVTQFGAGNYGTADSERANDIVVNGNVYITGFTSGNLVAGSSTSLGGEDAYVAMLSKNNGTILGIDQ